jgi:hypothetical protein
MFHHRHSSPAIPTLALFNNDNSNMAHTQNPQHHSPIIFRTDIFSPTALPNHIKMDILSSSPLAASSRLPSPAPSPTRTDVSDLPIEVEQSFDSSMSFTDTIAPIPSMMAPRMIRPQPVPIQTKVPLSLARSFGTELSINGSPRSPASKRGRMLPPAQRMFKPRGHIPMEMSLSNDGTRSPKPFAPALARREVCPSLSLLNPD